MSTYSLTAMTAGAIVAGSASGQTLVTGGQTSVLLDTATLSSAASLDLSGVSGPVISPGTIPGSVAFPINTRSAPSLPTTFAYDASNFLGTFSGTIEHEGSVLFNNDTVEVGNFTIGFDGARAGTLGGNASGFFVESTTGIAAILFDIENPTTLDATPGSLTIGANLLVSPEFGQFLLDNALSSSNLQGADVGDALVEAIPAPSSAALLGLAGLAAARRRR
ncbi:MAG: hypothetical protein AAGB48_06290 [Planctomycetota bacterium]